MNSTEPRILFTAATLTAAYTDNTVNFRVEGMADIMFLVSYTTGAAETNNVLDIKLDSALTNYSDTTIVPTVFYQMTSAVDTAGSVVLSPVEYHYTGASAATTYLYAFPVQLHDQWVRFSMKETGEAANFGVVSVTAVITNKYTRA